MCTYVDISLSTNARTFIEECIITSKLDNPNVLSLIGVLHILKTEIIMHLVQLQCNLYKAYEYVIYCIVWIFGGDFLIRDFWQVKLWRIPACSLTRHCYNLDGKIWWTTSDLPRFPSTKIHTTQCVYIANNIDTGMFLC